VVGICFPCWTSRQGGKYLRLVSVVAMQLERGYVMWVYSEYLHLEYDRLSTADPFNKGLKFNACSDLAGSAL